MCISTDKTLLAIAGQTTDSPGPMGDPKGGFFAVYQVGSPTTPLNIMGVKNTSGASQTTFQDFLLDCQVMPGSNQEWLVVAMEELMFSKIDHVLQTEESYYIPTISYQKIGREARILYVDAAGSIFIIARENDTLLPAYVFRISALGDTTATIAQIEFPFVRFLPQGITEQGNNLILAFYLQGFQQDIGVVTVDKTTMARSAQITTSGLYTDSYSYEIAHFQGNIFVSDYCVFMANKFGFVFFDLGANSLTTHTFSTSVALQYFTRVGVGIDSSLGVHAFIGDGMITSLISKPLNSQAGVFQKITYQNGLAASGVTRKGVWDGSQFYLATPMSFYNGQPSFWNGNGFAIHSSNYLCDCTQPQVAFQSVTLAQATDSIAASNVNNPATTTETIAAFSMDLIAPAVSVATFSNGQAALACTVPQLMFISYCLTDLAPKMGDPDLNIDIAACVENNGAALTAPIQATSVITFTDVTNGNADVLTYPYMNLNGETLEVASSTQGAAVTPYLIRVDYQITDGGTHTASDFFLFEIEMAQVAPVITIPPADDTHELGEGPVAFGLTATDANSDPLLISFSSGNAILDACCSVTNSGGDNYNVGCNCSNTSLVNGDNDVTYTVTLVANDGIDNSPAVTFQLTITSPNKTPVFTGLVTSQNVVTDTNPFMFNLNYQDANTGDTLSFLSIIVDPLQAATLVSEVSTGDLVGGGFKKGGQDLTFDFTGYVGVVTIQVQVQDDNSVGAALGTITTTDTITLTVQSAPAVAASSGSQNVNNPPFFKYFPEPIVLQVLETFSLNITFWADVDEGDTHSLTILEDELKYKQPDFTTFSPAKKFEVKPTSDKDIGSYLVKFLLEDDNSNACSCGVQSAILILSIKVLEREAFGDLQSEKVSIPEQIVLNLPEFFSFQYKSIFEFQFEAEGPRVEFLEFNKEGDLLIQFDSDIIPFDYNLNSTDGVIVDLNLITEYDVYKPEEMLRFWNIKKLEDNQLTLNITYEDPSLISYMFPYDKMNVTFVVPEIFRSIQTGGYLEGKLNFQIEVPTQPVADKVYERLQVLGTTLKSAAIGYFAIHLILRIALSLSLQHIWSLVNSLQIIVSFPMVAITFPRNMLTFATLFNDLSNFEFFPHELVNHFVFRFDQGSKALYQQFEQGGFDTPNFILNSGSFIWYIGFYLFSALVVLILTPCKKAKLVSKFRTWLINLLKFGFIIRLSLEQFIATLISGIIQVQKYALTEEIGQEYGEKLAFVLSFFFIVSFNSTLGLPTLYHWISVKTDLVRRERQNRILQAKFQ